MEFPGFLGNEQLKKNLSAAVDRQRTAHFYLISGPSGSGKHTLATLLAAALVCRSQRRPCCTCSQCRKMLSGSHADLYIVDDTEHKNVSIDVIRSAMERVSYRPNEAERNIFLFPRGQDIGLPGQNSLLKILEEPPAYSVFILLTDNAEGLLPTVRSRCVELKLQPLPKDVILTQLEKDFPDTDPEIRSAAASRCGGWLGQAKALLEEGGAWLPETRAFAEAYGQKDPGALLRLLVPLEKAKRDQLIPILEQWVDLLGAALTCRAGLPPLDPMTRKLAAGRNPKDLSHAISVLEESMEFLRGNVSPGAVCGNLVWQLQ